MSFTFVVENIDVEQVMTSNSSIFKRLVCERAERRLFWSEDVPEVYKLPLVFFWTCFDLCPFLIKWFLKQIIANSLHFDVQFDPQKGSAFESFAFLWHALDCE